MTVIGLTGQSGSGKTTVSDIFRSNGYEVINADKVARQVMEKGEKCLAETAEVFGENILDADGSLNRKALAEIVFSDRGKLDRLNAITYPHINKRIEDMLDTYKKSGADKVLLDAPTLFEAGEQGLCTAIVSVVADENIRLERIISRDHISRDAALKRFKSQHTTEFFIQNSHYIIENNGSASELTERTKEVIEKISENNNA